MRLILPARAYRAALSTVEPQPDQSWSPSGRMVTVTTEDRATYEGWIDRLAETACDMTDNGKPEVAESIYNAIERSERP